MEGGTFSGLFLAFRKLFIGNFRGPRGLLRGNLVKFRIHIFLTGFVQLFLKNLVNIRDFGMADKICSLKNNALVKNS
ncbi:MAG TPA: hypothetical protein DEP00_05875 [Lachnospiraceae bacterium]|nr:hypothetical protein [Lachnospiraceae bacterium]